MCRERPYPRCANHARKDLEKAKRTGDRKLIARAEEDFYLTLTGRKELREQGRHDEALNYYELGKRIKVAANAFDRRFKSLGRPPTSAELVEGMATVEQIRKDFKVGRLVGTSVATGENKPTAAVGSTRCPTCGRG